MLSAASTFDAIFAPVIAGTILLIALLSATQIRRFLGPLEKLREGTVRITAGDFHSRVNIASDDEFQQLGESFNTMTERLDNQFNVLSTVAEIDRLILSTSDPEYIVEALLYRLGPVLDCAVAGVIKFPQDPNTDAVLQVRHTNQQLISYVPEITIDEDVLAELNYTEQFLEFKPSALARKHSYLQAFASAEIGSLLVLPIRYDNRVAAAIIVGRGGSVGFCEEECSRAREIADRAAVALSNAAWEARLFHQAHYDSLTGLPNRALLPDRLDQALTRARENQSCVAVLFLDLDRFKSVNDSMGHGAGDALLQATAQRLQQLVGSNDSVIRFGGDEFILVLPDLPDDHQLTARLCRMCEDLLGATTTPFEIESRQLTVTTSIGISIYPRDAESAEELLKNADNAMYVAKSQGRDAYKFFAPVMNDSAAEQLELENDLRQAIRRNELELVFHPQVEMATGKISGAEVLLRWHHPEHGQISPGKFIPLAEQSGLISQIGEWVIENTCKLANEFRRHGYPQLRLAINLSARQFTDYDLPSLIRNAMDKYGVDARLIELEVTEGTIMTDVDGAVRTLQILSDMGFQLAVDDFGTGYSSLSYLARFPIDILKIDQSFVREMTSDPSMASIVSAIVNLAHSLNLKVIAEGVETTDQIVELCALGCEEVQGFFFSEPLSRYDFERFLQDWSEDGFVDNGTSTTGVSKLRFAGSRR